MGRQLVWISKKDSQTVLIEAIKCIQHHKSWAIEHKVVNETKLFFRMDFLSPFGKKYNRDMMGANPKSLVGYIVKTKNGCIVKAYEQETKEYYFFVVYIIIAVAVVVYAKWAGFSSSLDFLILLFLFAIWLLTCYLNHRWSPCISILNEVTGVKYVKRNWWKEEHEKIGLI